MAKAKNVEKLSYEEAFEELQSIVARLEGGALSLEEALAIFERGQALAVHCSALLESAELKLRELVPDDAGGYTERPFEIEGEV
jgi:exodeoxyribonuclease VII small subunit